MTAQEVRIGNWILDVRGNQVQVAMFSNFAFTQTKSIDDAIGGIFEQANGIPLSPSVLEACGFEFEDRADHGIFSIVVGEVGVYNVWHSPFGFGVQNDNASINRELKSLHQLQNHFYETTGQELIYNPTTK